ncbi:MAG TPA: iron dicitrate transport regulator FecR, partial [Planctomycetaceae bacterium]|nr:iron dicitrate transport regulator FecR [Planctomycetaceae bacterium]
MSTRPLSELLDCLVNETLTQEEHGTLQILLKSDKAAREQLRERLDVEAALATWASEIPQSEKGVVAPDLSAEPTSIRSHHLVRMTCLGAAAAAAIGLIILAAQLPLLLEQNDTSQASQVPLRAGPLKTRTEVGRLIQQADCKWSAPPLSNGRFAEGTLELTEGAAELRFDSGTNVVIEAPCKLQIDAADAAHLLAGAVFITVTEVSHGFLLTTADASIINEGTQYAVTHDTESTEVHVFEGAVVWTADNDALDFEDRIISGEARRFRRGRPDRPERITFGERQFVRQI